MAALTNGAAPTTTALLERAGLDFLVERVISTDAVRTWKPAGTLPARRWTPWVSNRLAWPMWPFTAGMSTAPATPG